MNLLIITGLGDFSQIRLLNCQSNEYMPVTDNIASYDAYRVDPGTPISIVIQHSDAIYRHLYKDYPILNFDKLNITRVECNDELRVIPGGFELTLSFVMPPSDHVLFIPGMIAHASLSSHLNINQNSDNIDNQTVDRVIELDKSIRVVSKCIDSFTNTRLAYIDMVGIARVADEGTVVTMQAECYEYFKVKKINVIGKKTHTVYPVDTVIGPTPLHAPDDICCYKVSIQFVVPGEDVIITADVEYVKHSSTVSEKKNPHNICVDNSNPRNTKAVYTDTNINYRDKEEDNDHMEPKTQSQVVVATFEIPEDIAKRLSELMVTQSIREKLLDQNIENPTKYLQMEKLLISITTEIDVLKNSITANYVPEQYRSDAYMWKFDGYEIDGCTVYIFNA